MRSRGLSGNPTVRAGQASWQRPHFVQASRLSMSFHEKSAIVANPAAPLPSSSAGRRRSAIRSRTAKEPTTARICLVLYQGIAPVKASASTPCSHQLAPRIAAAVSGVMPEAAKPSARAWPTGDQAAQAGWSISKRTPSCTKPVISIAKSTQRKAQSSIRQPEAAGRSPLSPR